MFSQFALGGPSQQEGTVHAQILKCFHHHVTIARASSIDGKAGAMRHSPEQPSGGATRVAATP